MLDAVTGKEKHRLTVSGNPMSTVFRAIRYVRALHSAKVGLLVSRQPGYALRPSGNSSRRALVPIGETGEDCSCVEHDCSFDDAGAFSPHRQSVPSTLMEGMNSPSSGVRTHGHVPWRQW